VSSNDPNWAEVVEAISTVVAAVAAIGAGYFAWRAWTATKKSLAHAQEALQIEQDRRAEERNERVVG
jgi:threonine/homoserine/homoserine lactone efflux protein